MANLIEIIFRATGGAQVKSEAKRVTDSVRAMQSALRDIAGALGFAGLTYSVVNAMRAGVNYNATLEQNTAAFKTLLGSMDAAQERMADLTQFAKDTPFELPEVVQASRLLESLTGGALASGEALRLVGDVAAATGRSFEEVSMWVGRLYAGLSTGTPVGEATLRLIELGAITGEQKRQLDELAQSGQGVGRAMEIVGETFARTSGAMAEQAQTFNGRLAALTDSIRMLGGALTQPLFEDLKTYIEAASVAVSKFNGLIGSGDGGTLKLLYELGTGKFNFFNAFTKIAGQAVQKAEEKLEAAQARRAARESAPALYIIHDQRDGVFLDEDEAAIDLAIEKQRQERERMLAARERELELTSEDAFWQAQIKREYEEQNRLIEQQNRDTERFIDLQKRVATEQASINSFQAQYREQAQALFLALGTAAQNGAAIITNTMGTAFRSIADNLSGLILQTQTWGQALLNIGRTILTSLVQSVVQFFVSLVARRVLAATLGTTIAATEAAALSAIYAGPAVLASIASFGGAAAAGPPAVMAALASAPAVAAVSTVAGFADGGFTGFIPATQPAGIVHGREFVFSAPAVERIGLPTLEAMHDGRQAPRASEDRPMRVVIVDSRRNAEELMRDPRWRNFIVDLAEDRT